MKRLLLLLSLPVLLFSCNGSSATGSKTAAEKTVSVRLKQRSTADLDSLLQGLELTIGDITQGQVVAGMSYKGTTVFMQSIVTKGRIVAAVNGKKISVYCVRLNNHLVGEDYGEFTITLGGKFSKMEATAAKDEKGVQELLEKIRNSNLTFIRNGDRHPGYEAAQFLETKWKVSGASVRTKADFIREIATKSTTTGEYYLVVLEDGTERRLGEWLAE